MKVNVIKNNLHKYSVSAICKVLQLLRSTYYHEAKQNFNDDALEIAIIKIFQESHSNYDTRKIKVELSGYQLSRSRIEVS